MERLEREIEGPSMIPEDKDLAFISRLIEEYADEWVNKYVISAGVVDYYRAYKQSFINKSLEL